MEQDTNRPVEKCFFPQHSDNLSLQIQIKAITTAVEVFIITSDIQHPLSEGLEGLEGLEVVL